MAIVRVKPGKDKAIRNRHPWVFGGAIAGVKGSPQPGDIVDDAERAILDIRMGGDGKDFKPVGTVLEEEITRWQKLSESGQSIAGVRSGFEDLDTITGGFQPGNLIILAGRPGIYSARFAGERATDKDNNDKLLALLRNVPERRRQARFVCLIALANPEKIIDIAEGSCAGTIVMKPRGSGGFGYDPLFQPIEYQKTFAELPPDVKNRISHRARAFEKALPDSKSYDASMIRSFPPAVRKLLV